MATGSYRTRFNTPMSGMQFDTPLGSGLGRLAGAFIPSAQRQLLGARAEGVGARTLAAQLKAQQSQFDLERDQEQAGRMDESIASYTEQAENNVPGARQFLDALALNPKNPINNINAWQAQINNRSKNQSREDMLKLNPQIAQSPIGGVAQPNIPIQNLMDQGMNISQIMSAGGQPFVNQANQASTNKRNSTTNLNNNELAQIQALQDSLKGIHQPLKNAKGELIANMPVAPLASNPTALTALLANNPKLQKIMADIGLTEDKALGQQLQNVKDTATLQPNIDKAFNQNAKAYWDSETAQKKFKLLEDTYTSLVGQEDAKLIIGQLKSELAVIESNKGVVKNFERLEDGTLVARGVSPTGDPFQVPVKMNGVPRIPKGQMVVTGDKGNEVISYVEPTELNRDDDGTTEVGDKKSRSKVRMLKLAKRKVSAMAVLLKEYGSQVTGFGGFVQQMKELAMAVGNIPTENAKGKRTDVSAQFERLGEELRLNVAPFILQTPGSRISDNDMKRLIEVTRTGSLGTGVTEIQDTIGIFYNALKNIEADKRINNQPAPGVTTVNEKFKDTSNDDLIREMGK